MKTLVPKKLKKGDTIGIISPSQSIQLFKEQIKGFERGIKNLRNMGFKIKIGKYTKSKYFYSAGKCKERLFDFHSMIKDKSVDAIFMSMGGETANELLDGINFDLITKNPKIICGMSDGCTLLNPITDKTGLITFYGPDVIFTFGERINLEVNKQIWDMFMNEKFYIKPVVNLINDNGKRVKYGWKCIRKGKVCGKLVGGYLEIVKDLVATKYISNLKGKILLLESMEGSHTIHMRLTYLKLLKVFDEIGGLVLGYFPDIKSNKNYYREIGDLILEITKGYEFPILKVNELGHGIANFAWPIGAKVELNATNKEINILEKCVG